MSPFENLQILHAEPANTFQFALKITKHPPGMELSRVLPQEYLRHGMPPFIKIRPLIAGGEFILI
jgi:hypothetical protein